MKYKIILLFFIINYTLYADPIRFRYDAAGNRIQRLVYVYDPTEEPEGNSNPGGRYGNVNQNELKDEQNEKEEKEFVSDKFKIIAFPNPAETSINVNIVDYEDQNLNISIFIFDNQGRQILQLNSNNINNLIDINQLQPGMYYLQVIFENKRVVYPFEKIRK